MRTTDSTKRTAFTLVELLVVIAIITLLAAIITPAVYVAVRRAKIASNTLEIAALEKALEAYKLEMGEYPPDFSELAVFEDDLPLDDSDGINTKADAAAQIIFLHLQRTYRRRDAGADLPPPAILANLSPRNALAFWLSGFHENPILPLTDPATSKSPLFEFDKGRMVLSDPDETPGPNEGWYSPKGSTVPYIYYRADPTGDAISDAVAYDDAFVWALAQPSGTAPLPVASSELTVLDPSASGSIGPGGSTPATMATYVAPNKFQLHSAGLDNEYGMFNAEGYFVQLMDGSYNIPPNKRGKNLERLPAFPSCSNLEGFPGLADNTTNFSGGQTLEDNKPE